jgi:hypothetical protein
MPYEAASLGPAIRADNALQASAGDTPDQVCSRRDRTFGSLRKHDMPGAGGAVQNDLKLKRAPQRATPFRTRVASSALSLRNIPAHRVKR